MYKHQDGRWTWSTMVNRKCIETVVFNESENGKLLKDIKDFLDPRSQKMVCQPEYSIPKGLLAIWV